MNVKSEAKQLFGFFFKDQKVNVDVYESLDRRQIVMSTWSQYLGHLNFSQTVMTELYGHGDKEHETEVAQLEESHKYKLDLILIALFQFGIFWDYMIMAQLEVSLQWSSSSTTATHW